MHFCQYTKRIFLPKWKTRDLDWVFLHRVEKLLHLVLENFSCTFFYCWFHFKMSDFFAKKIPIFYECIKKERQNRKHKLYHLWWLFFDNFIYKNIFFGYYFVYPHKISKEQITMASLLHILMGRNGNYFLNYIDNSKIFDTVLKLFLVI